MSKWYRVSDILRKDSEPEQAVESTTTKLPAEPEKPQKMANQGDKKEKQQAGAADDKSKKTPKEEIFPTHPNALAFLEELINIVGKEAQIKVDSDKYVSSSQSPFLFRYAVPIHDTTQRPHLKNLDC